MNNDEFGNIVACKYDKATVETPRIQCVKPYTLNYSSSDLARRRSSSLGRKRSSGSFVADTVSSSDQMPLSEKNSSTDGQVMIERKKFGTFMDDHEEDITTESTKLCQKLLDTLRKLPEHTIFSDELFSQVCKMVKGHNEAPIIRYILPELVPSSKARALRVIEKHSVLDKCRDFSLS